jgi:hypothetical protein
MASVPEARFAIWLKIFNIDFLSWGRWLRFRQSFFLFSGISCGVLGWDSDRG